MSRSKYWLLAVAVLLTTIVGGLAAPLTVYAGTEVEEQHQPCGDGDACEGFIETYINPFITLLTISIGVLAAISIVVAGIQYASAGSDPGKVQKAKDRIFQTIIGILAYLFLFSFLNYLVPGGLLG